MCKKHEIRSLFYLCRQRMTASKDKEELRISEEIYVILLLV